jgi:hypothetical protein
MSFITAKRVGLVGGLIGVIAAPTGDPVTCLITGALGFVVAYGAAKFVFRI